jgi:KTSC domain
MLNWIDVMDSTRITAMAYDSQTETIYVRFRDDGVEWWYGGCPPHIWEEFSSPATSKGQYIARSLNGHENGRWVG